MIDAIAPVHGCHHGRFVTDRPLDKADLSRGHGITEVGLGTNRQIIKDGDLPAARDKLVDKVAADVWSRLPR